MSWTRSPKYRVALLKIWVLFTSMRYRISPPLAQHMQDQCRNLASMPWHGGMHRVSHSRAHSVGMGTTGALMRSGQHWRWYSRLLQGIK